MKKYIFLSVLVGGSLFASNNLCSGNSGIDSYAHVCELFEAALRDTRECTLKDVLISNFETAQKNDAEYFFKGCLAPKMETILEKHENFDTKHGSEIEKLHKKFENLKKFSEKYCEYQTALIATDTGLESLQAIWQNMSLFKKLKNDIASEITVYYDEVKSAETPSKDERKTEVATEKNEEKKETQIVYDAQLRQLKISELDSKMPNKKENSDENLLTVKDITLDRLGIPTKEEPETVVAKGAKEFLDKSQLTKEEIFKRFNKMMEEVNKNFRDAIENLTNFGKNTDDSEIKATPKQPTNPLIDKINEALEHERSEQEKIVNLMKKNDLGENDRGIFDINLSTHKLLEEYYKNLRESISNK